MPTSTAWRRTFLLAVDQKLAELPRLRVAPERADRVDAVELGKA
jgi:hypothetical protein